MNQRYAAAEGFDYEGKLESIEKFGNGHINNTYMVVTTAKNYVLQQINTNVFPNVEGLMSNMQKVTDHISKKQRCGTLIKSKDGKNYVVYDNGYYRMYDLIEGICIDDASTPKDMYLTGLGFGKFQSALADFTEKLYEVIPNFHNTVIRYANFEKAVKENKADRAEECANIIKEFASYKKYCSIITDKLNNNEIPYRVTHNDTKINNIILDSEKNIPLSVIDLDTVMPGSVLYDFGDAVRSGCNSAKEDEEDTSRVYCKLDFFRAFCRGFFINTKDFLTDAEKKLLAVSGIILTYECGLRFLTDYLNGDIYFKVSKPKHNLIRCKTQLALVKDMVKNLDTLEDIVKEELGEIALCVHETGNFLNLMDTTTGEIKDDTYFAFSYDKKKLYFEFNCNRLYNKSKYETYNSPLYEGDIVELMITTIDDKNYLEVEVNQFNAQYCVLINNRDGKGDIIISYLPKSLVKSSVDLIDDNWAMYNITIERKELRKLGINKEFKFNAHRQIFDDKENLHLRSLNPTYSRTFHDTSAFMKVNFD